MNKEAQDLIMNSRPPKCPTCWATDLNVFGGCPRCAGIIEKPKKPYNPDDQPLNSGSTFIDNRGLRKGER